MSGSRNEYLCDVGKRGQSRLSILNAANQPHIDMLLGRLDMQSGMYLLDVGCGIGGISCQMAETYPDAHVVGIDFSEEQVKVARERAVSKRLNNAEFFVMSAYDIKHLAKQFQFDRIFIRWILGHITNPQLVIESCKLLLKPYGMIICEEGDIRTNHCESSNKLFRRHYGLFVSNIINLQKRRGVDPEIGAKLPVMFREAFKDESTIDVQYHQLAMDDVEKKEAVTTSFLDETSQKFVEEGILTSESLSDLKSHLDAIVHEDDVKILYTADVAVVVKMRQ